eukprot:CAMPEP_0201604244 /NCGR_PEP_ID=MMETSP0492-20130828/4450_1 /ASSEMBLY_ACC=CAM_ASM_000837 /TAXON_ID=420259 /ORGANISM="Thalassiosira gravida, Strain GMp14c1" /LENGTH=33 /DNA_ID= /DNA_START= /DNA_END= /DNA_ORIENTATION=
MGSNEGLPFRIANDGTAYCTVTVYDVGAYDQSA